MNCEKNDLALQMAQNLLKHSPGHHKSIRAIAKFEKYMKDKKFESSTDEFKELLKKWKKPTEVTIETAHELLKDDPKQTKKAITALESDPENFKKVYSAVKTHKRILKSDEKSAQEYFLKAQALYPYSSYFEGAKKD